MFVYTITTAIFRAVFVVMMVLRWRNNESSRRGRGISLVSKGASRGFSKKAVFAHRGCLIGCEVGISDVENPLVAVVDSSSL